MERCVIPTKNVIDEYKNQQVSRQVKSCQNRFEKPGLVRKKCGILFAVST